MEKSGIIVWSSKEHQKFQGLVESITTILLIVLEIWLVISIYRSWSKFWYLNGVNDQNYSWFIRNIFWKCHISWLPKWHFAHMYWYIIFENLNPYNAYCQYMAHSVGVQNFSLCMQINKFLSTSWNLVKFLLSIKGTCSWFHKC